MVRGVLNGARPMAVATAKGVDVTTVRNGRGKYHLARNGPTLRLTRLGPSSRRAGSLATPLQLAPTP